MKNRTLKISITCALSALIGAFVGIQYQYSVLIGMVIGGITGYVFWEAPMLIKAIPAALKSAYKEMPEKMPGFRVKIKRCIYCALPIVMIGAMFLISISFLIYENGRTGFHYLQYMLVHAPKEFLTIFLASCLIGMFTYLVPPIDSVENFSFTKRATWVLKYINPVMLPFTIVYYAFYFLLKTVIIVLKGIWVIFATIIPWVYQFAWKFTRKLFLLIHSEERILCLTYAAVSAGIGVLFHSVLIATVVGALIGFITSKCINTFRSIRMRLKY